MSMTLHLGVVDIPYSEPPSPVKRGRKPKRVAAQISTGDVAGFLEAEYHVMEVFFEANAEKIVGYLEHSLAGTLEGILMGAPLGQDAFGTATSDIEERFRDFLSNKEMEALGYPGVPTQAALQGISHRFKNKRGPKPRPSFIDTGLYQASFKAWIS